LRLYIMSICGGTNIPAALRANILDYVERRVGNREAALLSEETDLEYVNMLIESDWDHIRGIQEKYNETMAEYMTAIQNQDTAKQEQLNALLDYYKDALEELENRFQNKRQEFARMQLRNFRLN